MTYSGRVYCLPFNQTDISERIMYLFSEPAYSLNLIRKYITHSKLGNWYTLNKTYFNLLRKFVNFNISVLVYLIIRVCVSFIKLLLIIYFKISYKITTEDLTSCEKFLRLL